MLLRYLWLVLPFWQAIESVTKQADELSPFIWSDVVEASESKEKKLENETESEVGQGDELGEPNYKAIYQSKQWTSERIRKIIQKQSGKWLGEKLNINTWRHIIIGISCRYLGRKFVVDEAEEEVD